MTMGRQKRARVPKLLCGGCFRTFVGTDANEQLRAHVQDDPCEHYAKVPPEQLIASEYEVELHQRKAIP